MDVPITISLLGSVAIALVAFSLNRQARISACRIRLVSIRMHFSQLVQTGVIRDGAIHALMDAATKKSIEENNGITLWDIARQKGIPDSRVRKMVEELERADPRVQDLFSQYLSTEMEIILHNSPILVACLRLARPCVNIVLRVKRALAPRVTSRRYQAYTFYQELSRNIHEHTNAEVVIA